MYTVSHLLVGLGGGLPGGRLMSHTILINQSLPELRTKATMLFNTAVFVVAWVFDPPIARYIPRCFAAGLLIFIGISMFFEFAWTIRTRVTPQVPKRAARQLCFRAAFSHRVFASVHL